MKLLNILVLISVTYASENSSQIATSEGRAALLGFRFKSELPAPFTLGIGHRLPFFTEGQFASKHLSVSQLHRFEVNAWHSESRGYTIIHLKINRVSRTDDGTYYCQFGSARRTQAVALNVHFPPGRVECRVYPTNESMWEMLQCSATGGSPRGRIVCLDSQNVEIPVGRDVRGNDSHIIQEISIRPNSSAYCCARNHASPLSYACHEFVLQRESSYGMNGKTTSKPVPTKTSNYSPVTTLSSISQGKNATTSAHNIWTYISLVALAIAFIGLATTICLCFVYRRHIERFLKTSKDVELQRKEQLPFKDSKTENTPDGLPPEREPPSTEFKKE